MKDPKKFYDHGFDARMKGRAYDKEATKDWRDGWKDADESLNEESVPCWARWRKVNEQS